MRYVTIAAALATLLTTSAPAWAADDIVIHNGDTLRDANKVRLGTVNAVNKDGSIGIIYNARYVTLPVATLKMVDGKLVTSLTKAEINLR